MSAFFDALERRRTALIERSTAQRGEVAAAAAGVRRTAAEPVLLGAGLAVALLTSSPKLRGWAVRAWAAYVFLRRLLDR